MAHVLSIVKAVSSAPPLVVESTAVAASLNVTAVSGSRQGWQGAGGLIKSGVQGGSYAQAARQSPTRVALPTRGNCEQEIAEGGRVVGRVGTSPGGGRPPIAVRGRVGSTTRVLVPLSDGAGPAAVGNGFGIAGKSTSPGWFDGSGEGRLQQVTTPGASRSGRSAVACKGGGSQGYGRAGASRGVGGTGGESASTAAVPKKFTTPRRQRWVPHASPLKVAALQPSRIRNPKPLDLGDASVFPQLTPPLPLKRAVVVGAAKGKKGVGGAKGGEEESGPLKRGVMIEFERDGGGGNKIHHTAVLQRPDGKKNWMVTDQLGNNHSIRPQQVTFVVPPRQTMDPYSAADIQPLIEQADQAGADSDLLELAWESLSGEEGASLDAMGMAELLFTGTSAVDCLAAHRLLSADRMFFKSTKRKGPDDLWVFYYEPRPVNVVEEVKRQVRQEEERRALVSNYAQFAARAAGAPRAEKPAAEEWEQNESFALRTAALKRFAMDDLENELDRRVASEVLDAMGCPKNPSVVFELLVKMGIFQPHTSLELLNGAIRTRFNDDVQAEAERRAVAAPPDPSAENRVDLRHLKVYMIDSDDTLEIDDGVSVERLPDGRKRLWVHVADPTRWVAPGDVLDYEARQRATSAYLPTGAVPMFPMVLAGGGMSLLQGRECTAMSVGVVLREDGSIEEKSIVASRVRPTYRLSYEEVDELLQLGLDEEPELRTLLEEAHRRHEYRYEQDAIEIKMPDCDIRATDLESDPPRVSIKLINEQAPSRRLVEEMMIMAGEAVAWWGSENSVPLPYRGQERPDLPDFEVLDKVPAGYCQSVIVRRCMTRSQINCRAPIPHSSLGLSAYVQFSSPIRRYGDLLAHYQVKAVLRGDPPPFSSDELSGMISGVEAQCREVKRLTRVSERYWMLEWFRQQPKSATWRALVLKFLKEDDLLVLILIYELGLELPVRLQRSVRVGSDIQVRAHRVNVRLDVLELVETYQPQEAAPSPASPPQNPERAATEASISDAFADTSFREEAGFIVGSKGRTGFSEDEMNGSHEGEASTNGANGQLNGHPQSGVLDLENGAEIRESERVLVREAGS